MRSKDMKIAVLFLAAGMALALLAFSLPATVNVLVYTEHHTSGAGSVDVRSYLNPHRILMQVGIGSVIVGVAALAVCAVMSVARGRVRE